MWPLALLWLVAFAAGSVGMAQRLTTSHRTADYGSYITWGLWVAVYQYLVELAAGAFLIAAAIYLLRLKSIERLAPVALLLGIVSLVAGILAVWVDLGRMERFWRVMLAPNFSSIIAWVVIAYTAFLIVSVVALWFTLRTTLAARASGDDFRAKVARAVLFGREDTSPESRERDLGVVRVLMIVGMVPAIGFGGGEGALLGVVGARPYWNSATFPIVFLASAVVIAAATLTVLAAFFLPAAERARADAVRFTARLTIVGLVALLLLQFAEYSIGLYASVPAQADVYREILTGQYWWSFWLIHIVLGAAVPLAIFAFRGSSIRWLGLAALLAAMGVFIVRLNAVVPGQMIAQIEGLPDAFVDRRLALEYFPSSMEWLVSLFIFSVGVLLFFIAYQLLFAGSRATRNQGAMSAATIEGGD
jgi:protein NrfD